MVKERASKEKEKEESKPSAGSNRPQIPLGPNNLKMNKFHRVIKEHHGDGSQKAKRRASDKKQIRDIERLLDREGLPQEIRAKKLEDLKNLKKQLRHKQQAEKFEDRYKKIKFFEKRKVIRKLEQIDKAIKKKLTHKVEDEDMDTTPENALTNKEYNKMTIDELKELQTDWKNKLIYIDVSPSSFFCHIFSNFLFIYFTDLIPDT